MSNTNKPLITVIGATGAQGGSVVKYLLDDPAHTFRVRGISRNTESAKAKDLTSRGVEVVKADLNDTKSLEKAFDGTYGVFAVTNFWESQSEEKEIQQGKGIVDAAAAAGVKHFVWSTLEHTSDPSVPHWNSKATVDDYLKESQVPRTSLYTSFYFENLLVPAVERKGDGKVVISYPTFVTDGPVGGISVDETGAYAREAFKKSQNWLGKDMRIVSQVITPRQFVETLREVVGKDIELRETDRAAFDALKSTNYELWSNMQWFYKHNGNPSGRDPELTLQINPARKDIRAFIEQHKKDFLSVLNA